MADLLTTHMIHATPATSTREPTHPRVSACSKNRKIVSYHRVRGCRAYGLLPLWLLIFVPFSICPICPDVSSRVSSLFSLCLAFSLAFVEAGKQKKIGRFFLIRKKMNPLLLHLFTTFAGSFRSFHTFQQCFSCTANYKTGY